jgi:hypothetical protein
VKAAGIPEFICSSAEEFVERAVAFGKMPSTLEPFRERLRASRDSCTLFDTPSLVLHLEQLYRQMWEYFKEGALPRPDLTNLDVYLEVGNQVDPEEVEVQSIADYRGWWHGRLARRHSFRPIAPDRRFAQGAPFDRGAKEL